MRYLECADASSVAKAIRSMAIRGAPAIGVAAAMGIALAAQKAQSRQPGVFYKSMEKVCQQMRQTRPTAVNLFWAVDRMKRVLDQVHSSGVERVRKRLEEEARKIYEEDIEVNRRIGENVLTAIKNKGLAITTPMPGTVFYLGQAQCTILAPNSPTYKDMNNYSIVIRLVYGTTSFLFTGDAEAESEKEMLSKGYNIKSDVLKVGHHGSNTATSPEFLKAVSPKYAVISVGKGNDYGHPHQVTLDKLAGGCGSSISD